MFADYTDIDAQIIDIINANAASTFSTVIDTSDSGDERRSNGAITEARRKSAYRILEALGSNVSHPYWRELATEETVTHGANLPPHYGEIGVPLIKPYSTFTGGDGGYLTGVPRTPDEVESVLLDSRGTFTNYYGKGKFAPDTVRRTDVLSPVSLWYATQNGRFLFTGNAAKVPMIKIPSSLGDAETQADTKIPLEFSATNVRLAVGLLMKEGDANIIRLGLALAQWGEQDLMNIKTGAMQIQPINIAKITGLSQQLRGS